MNLDFLKQTAIDYDLPLWLVEKTRKNYPGPVCFYEQLEILVNNRNNN